MRAVSIYALIVGMTAKRDKIKAKQLGGFKYFKALSGILENLHDANCARDRANNRILHMDQYMALLLLYMFNPICSSLRAVQQASELKKVQQILGCPRASLGSLSESARVFDSKLMEEIVQNLGKKLKPISSNSKLDDLAGVLTAVDGTLINGLAKMTWALWKPDENGIRIHTQFDMEKYVPVRMDVTVGKGNEKHVLAKTLEAGRIYVTDRGYASFALLQDIIDAKSSFVCRLRDNSVYACLEERDLSEDAINANVLFDKTVRPGSDVKTRDLLAQPIRLIAVKCTPHKNSHRNGRGGPEQGEYLLIATDRFDLDADVVALIFKHRWMVETFFNFFKHVLGCRHLLSECKNGIELQTYAAIIACMLIALWTGRKPTLRTYEMLCWYFTGMADEEELQNHIARLKLQD